MNNYDNQIITPIYPLQKEEIHDPNIVKVVINERKDAMYFSRSVIPHIRDEKNIDKYSESYIKMLNNFQKIV